MLVFEVAYAIICTDGLPLWVLVHDVADMKVGSSSCVLHEAACMHASNRVRMQA